MIGAHQFYLKNKIRAYAFLLTHNGPVFLWCLSMMIFANGDESAVSTPGAEGSAIAMMAGQSVGGIRLLGNILAIAGACLWLKDLFTLFSQTDSANEKIEREILEEMAEIGRAHV